MDWARGIRVVYVFRGNLSEALGLENLVPYTVLLLEKDWAKALISLTLSSTLL